jgi:hypothetical protein
MSSNAPKKPPTPLEELARQANEHAAKLRQIGNAAYNLSNHPDYQGQRRKLVDLAEAANSFATSAERLKS